jgi:hypothetical protein
MNSRRLMVSPCPEPRRVREIISRFKIEMGRTACPHEAATHVRFGSKADIATRRLNVRFTPKSGHCLSALGCPLCAKSGHCEPYSMTSFGAADHDCGTVMPSALATSGAGKVRSCGRTELNLSNELSYDAAGEMACNCFNMRNLPRKKVAKF